MHACNPVSHLFFCFVAVRLLLTPASPMGASVNGSQSGAPLDVYAPTLVPGNLDF
jgi:hypothetical protein